MRAAQAGSAPELLRGFNATIAIIGVDPNVLLPADRHRAHFVRAGK